MGKGPQYISSIRKRVHNTLVNTESVYNILFNVEKGPQWESLVAHKLECLIHFQYIFRVVVVVLFGTAFKYKW